MNCILSRPVVVKNKILFAKNRMTEGKIFMTGAVVGILFAYSGILTFGAGFIGGFMFARHCTLLEPVELYVKTFVNSQIKN